jgi:subtilisin family serine protease
MKKLLLVGAFALISSAQAQDKLPNWQNLDFKNDGVRGISTEKAYKELLQGKTSSTIIVGVIDSGIEVDHEDLKDVIWVNPKETKNGKDDDKNGFVDDINGWDFLGGKNGKDISQDSYEVTREYARLKKKYKDESKVPASEKAYFEKVKKAFTEKATEAQMNYNAVIGLEKKYKENADIIEKFLKKASFSREELDGLQTDDKEVKKAKQTLLSMSLQGLDAKSIEEYKKYFGSQVNFGLNEKFDPRKIVGDKYTKLNEKGYGNNEVEGPDAQHGSHVAGIIGAKRGNGKGIEGVADNVKILVVRTVPDGDERDKDVANAIMYAVDNGARVINMSFGKSFSPNKAYVDEAVRYAEKKGVLLVHAAGNDAKDIDTEDNYPNTKMLSGEKPNNWIEVGASDQGKTNDKFVASFSNYGQTQVDVFAPGVDIYSTVPDQKYEYLSGTSMAAPVVAGAAALLLSYYPHLTASQVKEILIKSSIKYHGEQVNKPNEGAEKPSTIDFGKLSNSGGIINVYEAIKLAETYPKK